MTTTSAVSDAAQALEALVHFASSAHSTAYAQNQAATISAHIADLEARLAEARERSDNCERLMCQTMVVANENFAIAEEQRQRAEAAEAKAAASEADAAKARELLAEVVGPAGADFCMSRGLEAAIEYFIKEQP